MTGVKMSIFSVHYLSNVYSALYLYVSGRCKFYWRAKNHNREREEIASSLAHEYISISKTKKTANNECHEVNKRKHQEKYLNFNRVFFFKWRSINLIIKAESVI